MHAASGPFISERNYPSSAVVSIFCIVMFIEVLYFFFKVFNVSTYDVFAQVNYISNTERNTVACSKLMCAKINV